MFVTNRIFEAPADDPTDPVYGSSGSKSSNETDDKRHKLEALARAQAHCFIRFIDAASRTPLGPEISKQEAETHTMDSSIKSFTNRRPSDILIASCIKECNVDLAKTRETLSAYESMARHKVDDRFIPVFEKLSTANRNKVAGWRYTKSKLADKVIVPISRIPSLRVPLLTKFVEDLAYDVKFKPALDDLLDNYVTEVSDIARLTPSPGIQSVYDDALTEICKLQSNSSRLVSSNGLNIKNFLQSLAQFSPTVEERSKLDSQIKYTKEGFSSIGEFTTKYLLPTIGSFVDFRTGLKSLPTALRERTKREHGFLATFTKSSQLPLHNLNALFAAATTRDDFTNEELDIMCELYLANLGYDTKSLARLISWTDDSALEVKRAYRNLVRRASKVGNAELNKLVGHFNRILQQLQVPDPRYLQAMIRCFNTLIDTGNFNNDNIEVIGNRFYNVIYNSNRPISNLALNKYISAIRQTSDNHDTLFRQLSLITAHDILMQNISDTDQTPEWEYFAELFHNGEMPFQLGTAEYDRCAAESQGIMRASFNAHYGFGALANDAKGWRNSILARFGRDVALSPIQAPRCLDGNQFPGMGYVITGLNDEFLHIPDPSREMNGDEAYQDFISNYPFLASVAEDIDSTQFILLRGMIVVTNLKDGYHLPDRNGNRIPYSLVIYNDHFHNNGYDIAFLVPSSVVLSRIKPSLFYVYDSDAPDPPPRDINSIRLDIESLRAAAHTMNASIVNLGWSSNIAGLCNAWEPNCGPYHGWEAAEPINYRDLDGHKHKWFALSDPEGPWSQLTEDEMRPFQNQHAEVYSVAKRFFDNLNSFKLFLSAYKHGYMGNFDQSTDLVSGDESKRVFANAAGFETSSDNDIMLDQAYLLRQAAVRRQSQNFPKLVVYDTYRWSSEPIEGFELDLADMTLTFAGTTHQLSLDDPTETDREIWREAFSQFSGLDYDFRFYEEGLNQH